MTDLFSYPGEANPNDIKASDPTVLRSGGAVDGTAFPAGVSVTAAVGTAIATGAAVVSPVGVSALASVGTATATGAATVMAVGVATTSAVGAPVGHGAAVTSPVGVTATATVGTPIGTGAGVAAPFGVGMVATVGAAVASGDEPEPPPVDVTYWRGAPWIGHPKAAYPMDGALR